MRDLLVIVPVAAVAGFIIGVIRVALIQPWAERHFFAGPRLDEWRHARRQLRGLDQSRVIWATSRNRPVSRSTLAGAQLALVRYRQDAARRAPFLRWLRTAIPAIFGVVAAGCAALAVAHSQRRTADSVVAAGCAIFGLGWWLVLPWVVRRLTDRWARLQAQIERAPEMPPQGR